MQAVTPDTSTDKRFMGAYLVALIAVIVAVVCVVVICFTAQSMPALALSLLAIEVLFGVLVLGAWNTCLFLLNNKS